MRRSPTHTLAGSRDVWLVLLMVMALALVGVYAVRAAQGGRPAPVDGVQLAAATEAPGADPTPTTAAPDDPAPSDSAPPANNGLEILGNTCEGSQLDPHDGFQNGGRCVSTSFGEVGTQDDNPTLLIVSRPWRVRANQPFDLKISTRNLIRDRFLKAAVGGYYLESSFLDGNGLQRGHFHVGCRMLDDRTAAPAPEPVPAFFKAIEDGGGGSAPDVVTVQVAGLPTRGLAQCAVWAGDGSHRIPMMQRANQIPAFDVVRIRVR